MPNNRPWSDRTNEKIEEMLEEMTTLFSCHNTMGPFWNGLDFDRKQNIRYEIKKILDSHKQTAIPTKIDSSELN